jgi:hypothetical protein
VQVIFAGNGLKGKQIFRAVKPNDIAPTLSAVVNAKAPSGANGDILEEVMEGIK